MDDDPQEAACAQACWAAGFGVYRLSSVTQRARQFGLIIGFADANPARAAGIATVLAHALDRFPERQG